MAVGFARRCWLRALVAGSALAWGLGGARALAQTDAFFGSGTMYGGYSGGYVSPSTSYYSYGGLYSPSTPSYGGYFGGYGGSYYSTAGRSSGSSAYGSGLHGGSGYFFGHGYVGPTYSY